MISGAWPDSASSRSICAWWLLARAGAVTACVRPWHSDRIAQTVRCRESRAGSLVAGRQIREGWMSAKKRIAALSGLDGVREVSLIGRDGNVLESSADAATLADAAPRLGQALRALQMALPGLGAPMSLTLEAENGALHVA